MIQDFMIWLAIGAGTRLSVGLAVSRYFDTRVTIPSLLTGPIILGATIAKLTFLLPVPLGLVLGLVLQDAVLERRS